MSYEASDHDIIKEKEDRIVELEEQRKKELENRKWMASCPERKHSYGQYPFFEKSKCIILIDLLYIVSYDVHILCQYIAILWFLFINDVHILSYANKCYFALLLHIDI